MQDSTGSGTEWLQYRVIAGVDEAGRGPLAGPVVAAAVILDAAHPIGGLGDSKTLSAKRREGLDVEIRRHSLCWAIGTATVEEIDRLNILQATLLAMRRAVDTLQAIPELVLVDGNRPPALSCPVEAIVGGDAKIPVISAASILAKVARDAMMQELDQQFPAYGFAIHKGYPTPRHLAALGQFGISPVHRRSFAPVKKYIK